MHSSNNNNQINNHHMSAELVAKLRDLGISDRSARFALAVSRGVHAHQVQDKEQTEAPPSSEAARHLSRASVLQPVSQHNTDLSDATTTSTRQPSMVSAVE